MMCRTCGVILEEHLSVCPLCGGTDHQENGAETPPGEYSLEVSSPALPSFRQLMFRVVSVIWATGAAVVLLTGVLVHPAGAAGVVPLWAVVTLLTLGVSWVVAAVALRGAPGVLPVVAGVTAVALYFLALEAVIGGRSAWALRVAIPVLLVVTLVSVALFSFLRRRSPAMRVVLVLVAAGICVTGVDLVVGLFLHQRAGLSWSVVVLVSLGSLAAALAVLHLTVFRYVDLHRRLRL